MPMFTPNNTNFLSNELRDHFRELSRARDPKWRFVLSRVAEDESEAILTGAESCAASIVESHERLLNLLPANEPCWAIFNVPFVVSGGGNRNKLILIHWIPKTIVRPTRKEVVRVQMASVVQGGMIKASLGVTHNIHASSRDELSLPIILEVLCRYEREPIDLDASLTL